MRVMVVDDSKTMRNIIVKTLNGLGINEIEQATDGQDAMSKLIAFDPELILLDWNMPNMDGLTFTRKARESGAAMPIIMVTTESEKPRVLEAIKAGVNNYVVKPFTPEALQARVNETMAKAKAA